MDPFRPGAGRRRRTPQLLLTVPPVVLRRSVGTVIIAPFSFVRCSVPNDDDGAWAFSFAAGPSQSPPTLLNGGGVLRGRCGAGCQ